MAELTTAQFEAAKARGEALLRGPRAQSAHFDAGRNRVIIQLTTGVEIGFAPHTAQGLENATAGDLEIIEVSEMGLGVHFPKLDADDYIPALIEGVLGSKSFMARRLGETGGKSRSAAKKAAARATGARGDRPRRSAAPSQ